MSVCLSSGAVPRKGLTTPLTRRVVTSCYLCAGVVYVVLLGSPTGLITLVSYLREIPTTVVLHHPFLFGEKTDVASSDIKRNFWRRSRGRSSTSTRFLITNIISSQFTLFSICLSFSSPPLHKKIPFYLPSFWSTIFSSDLFFACVQCVFYLLASLLAKYFLIWILIHLLIFLK